MQMEHESETVAEATRHEIEDAKARLSSAAEAVRHEVRSGGSTITSMVMDELDRRTADLGRELQSLAERLRTAVAQDGDMTAPRLLTPAIDLMEDASRQLEGQSARQIGQAISGFGAKIPSSSCWAALRRCVVAGRLIAAADVEPRLTDSDHKSGGGIEDRANPYRSDEFRTVYDQDRGEDDWQSGTQTRGLGGDDEEAFRNV